MTEQISTLTTLTREGESDLVDDQEMTVEVVGGTEPPEDLVNAVHEAVLETIGSLLDGHSLRWEQRENGWRFTFMQGMPEYPKMGDGMSVTWLPPYRTAEKFEGVDGSGDGLYENLPGAWEYEKERQGVYDFYEL